MNTLFEPAFDPHDIRVNIAEMLVATADISNDLVVKAVRDACCFSFGESQAIRLLDVRDIEPAGLLH